MSMMARPRKAIFPYAGLVSDGAGFLWGTTQHGGLGNGTVFKMDEITGELTTLVEFTDQGATNRGAEPRAMLANDGAGFFWGSTSEGAAANAGTLFKINISTGELTTVLEFTGNGGAHPGARPNAELVSDGAGSFWGTTYQGSIQDEPFPGYPELLGVGTIFKVDIATGELTSAADFTTDANFLGYPYAAVARDREGVLWGTTSGAVFKFDPNNGALSQEASVNHEPRAKLLDDGAGFFWGTASETPVSEAPDGFGSIFRVNASTGELTTVVEFTGRKGLNPGSEPKSQLVDDGAGYFWGTTWTGGARNHGTIFKLDPATGELTTVLEFTGPGTQANNGSLPGYGSLLLHSDGNIYGVTQEGGPEGGGTIFRLRFGPTPVTMTADAIGQTSATLHGTINPNGTATAVSFEIGTDPALDGAAMLDIATTGSATSPEIFSHPVSDLVPNTTYYYRINGTNSENLNPQHGTILSFTTLPNVAPTVTLVGSDPLTIEAATTYLDAGATASDPEDGALTPQMSANTVVANVPGEYAVTWITTDSDGATGSATRSVKVVDTTAPLITAPADVTLGTLDPAGSIVTYPDATVTDLVGVTEVSYSPPNGSLFPRGTTTVSVTARDAAGNQRTATFAVTVNLTETMHAMMATKGSAVPGAGIDPRIPAGAIWDELGVPAIGDSGQMAFMGRWKTPGPGQRGSGLFVDGVLWVSAGEASPIAGAAFASFKDPFFPPGSDSLLVPAKLAGVSPNKNQVLLALTAGGAMIIAQEGDSIGQQDDSGVGRVSRFLGTTTIAGGIPLVVAQVRGAGDPVGAQKKSAVYVAGTGKQLLVATGETILGRTLKRLRLLGPVPGSPGHGRGESSAAGMRFIARFTDKTEAIVEDTGAGEFRALASTGDSADPVRGDGMTYGKFGAAVSSTIDGELFAFLANLDGGTTQGASNQGVFLGSADGIETLVRTGDAAPTGAGETFNQLNDPVLAADGSCVAFVGRSTNGEGRKSQGVFARHGDDPLSAVAASTTAPPGAPVGARWKAFTSLAAPGGGLGPLFTAKLEGAGITMVNDTGIWVVDTSGTLRCVAREGDLIEGKTLRKIHVLQAVRGTPGVTRAFNGNTQIVWSATFTDGTTAIIATTVP